MSWMLGFFYMHRGLHYIPFPLLIGVILTGCSLSKALIEWQIDSAIEDFIDDVDPPASGRPQMEWLGQDIKNEAFEVLYDASEVATEVQRELESGQPDVGRVRAGAHRLIDRIEGLPVPSYLSRFTGWYGRLDQDSQRRFWTAIKKREKKPKASKEKELARKKAHEARREKLMNRLNLDASQRKRAMVLIRLGEEEQKASSEAWEARNKVLKAELAQEQPDVERMQNELLAGWEAVDTGRWKETLDRWLDFYSALRPEQKKEVHRYFAKQLDGLPRLRR